MNDVQVKNPLAKAVAIMHGSKDIRKNREGLIRHFIYLGKTRDEAAQCCSKARVLRFIGLEPREYPFVGLYHNVPSRVETHFNMSREQWHRMEFYYEQWHHEFGGTECTGGPKKTYLEVAGWLQTLPGWPRVL